MRVEADKEELEPVDDGCRLPARTQSTSKMYFKLVKHHSMDGKHVKTVTADELSAEEITGGSLGNSKRKINTFQTRFIDGLSPSVQCKAGSDVLRRHHGDKYSTDSPHRAVCSSLSPGPSDPRIQIHQLIRLTHTTLSQRCLLAP